MQFVHIHGVRVKRIFHYVAYVIQQYSVIEYDCADSCGNFYCANYHNREISFPNYAPLGSRRVYLHFAVNRDYRRESANRGGKSRARGYADSPTISSAAGARKEVNSWTGHFRQVFRSSKILCEITLPIVLCAIPDGCTGRLMRGLIFPFALRLRMRDIRETT